MASYSGSSISGATLAVPLQTAITDQLQTSTEIDYFKISGADISVDSLITLDFGVASASSNNEYSVSIVDDGGTSLATTSTGQNTSLTYQATAGVTYYAKVEKGADAFTDAAYSLNVAVVGTSEVVGNNDTQANANALLENVNFTGSLATTSDVDVFAFTTGPAGGTVSLSVAAASSATTSFYDIKLTNDAGTTIVDSSNASVSTTVTGNSNGTLSFDVTASDGQTPQGTYFLTISNNAAATTPDTKYTINLAGTSELSSVANTHDYNNAPTVTMGNMTSTQYGTTKVSDETLSVNMGSSVNLSDIITVADADSSSATNGTVKSYVVALYDTSSPVTYSGSESAYDGYISFGSTASYVNGMSTQGSGFFTSISAADFATAKYYAGTSANTQTLYVAAIDSSGSSTLSSTTMANPLDTSGFVTMAVASTDASVSVVSAGITALKEGNTSATYSDTLTISVAGVTMPSSGSVVVVLDPGDDLAISGSALTASNAVTLNAANSYSTTVVVVAKSDAITELSHTGALTFTSSSSDSAFNNLSIDGFSYTITEQVANFAIGSVTYSGSNTSVLEGTDSRTGTYTITATDIPEGTTLNLSVTGTGLQVTSSTLLAFTYDSGNSVTQTVTFIAEDDVSEEASPHTGTLSHTVVDTDGDPLSQYTGAVGDASASITDNDDQTAPTASIAAATITNSGSAVIQSTEVGTAYLVNTSITVTNLASITGAADTSWNTASVTTAANNTNVAATGLVDGTYKVYTTDASGNLSNASASSLTIDSSTPMLTAVTVSVDSVIDSSDTDLTAVAFAGTTSDVNDSASVSITIGGVNTIVTVTSNAFSGTIDLSGVADSDSVSIYGGVGSSASVPLQYSSSFIKDVVGPSVDSVAISSVTGAQNNRLNAGDVVSVTVTLDDSSIVTGSPVIALTIGSATANATYVSGTGSASLLFQYTVLANDVDSNGISIAANALGLSSGSIVDARGNAAILTHNAVTDNSAYKVDTAAPSVSSVAFTSAIGAESNTLGTGDTLDITVTMSEVTTVTGVPQLALVVGSGAGAANYLSGSGTSSLVFRYTAVLGDTDTDGISMLADQLSLNSGTMADAAGNAATLSHSAVAADSNYMVAAIKTFDAQITTSSTQGITGLDLELWAGGASSAAATYTATNGEITVPTSQTVAQVKLSVAAAYNMADAIDISDVLLTVKDIIGVSSLTGNAQHAADVNNDASVDISDVLSMVKHVIGIAPIDHFDLIDSNSALVTELTPLTSGNAPQYQLVMNGDVNGDGDFANQYVGTLDIT